MITQEYHHLIRNIPIEQATKKFVRIHELTLIFYGNKKDLIGLTVTDCSTTGYNIPLAVLVETSSRTEKAHPLQSTILHKNLTNRIIKA